MTISRQRAVLFTKENCKPCELTKELVFALKPALHKNLSVMKKENHSALVEAYQLELFPTFLIVDDHGEEIDRLVGGQRIRDNIVNLLSTINRHNDYFRNR